MVHGLHTQCRLTAASQGHGIMMLAEETAPLSSAAKLAGSSEWATEIVSVEDDEFGVGRVAKALSDGFGLSGETESEQ